MALVFGVEARCSEAPTIIIKFIKGNKVTLCPQHQQCLILFISDDDDVPDGAMRSSHRTQSASCRKGETYIQDTCLFQTFSVDSTVGFYRWYFLHNGSIWFHLYTLYCNGHLG